MLTKDLIRARVYRDRIHPQFVEARDPQLLSLAEQLLAVYHMAPPPTRSDLADHTAPLLRSWPDQRIPKGLNKLLLDCSEFTSPKEQDYAEFRAKTFAESARLLKAGDTPSLADYRTEVAAGIGHDPDVAAELLYADLPGNDRLVSVRDMTPEDLLGRYNVALVQSLLLRASVMTVTVGSDDQGKLRRLFKYLKFFRLLAALKREDQTKPKRGGRPNMMIRAEIDGPASMFEHSKRYGLQLATFFPAVCAMDRWEVTAELRWRNRDVKLRVDQSCNLPAIYRRLSAYIPREIRLFHSHFRDKQDTWKIVGHTPFLDGGRQELVFPDISFEGPGSAIVHMELFHRWHAGPLQRRVKLLTEKPDLPLIIGVDRALRGKLKDHEGVESAQWFQERAFWFRDFPTIPKVVRCLEKACRKGSQNE